MNSMRKMHHDIFVYKCEAFSEKRTSIYQTVSECWRGLESELEARFQKEFPRRFLLRGSARFQGKDMILKEG